MGYLQHNDKTGAELESTLKLEINKNFKFLKNKPLFFIGQLDITEIRHDITYLYIFMNEKENTYICFEQSTGIINDYDLFYYGLATYIYYDDDFGRLETDNRLLTGEHYDRTNNLPTYYFMMRAATNRCKLRCMRW